MLNLNQTKDSIFTHEKTRKIKRGSYGLDYKNTESAGRFG